MPFSIPFIDKRYSRAVEIAILFFIYVVTARLGLGFYAVHGFATLVWPPTGIAIAVLLLYGRGLWPGIALGAFVVNLSIGAPPFVAAGIALGNTLEAYVAAYLLKESIGFDTTFSRLRDSVAFIVYAALMGPAISATIGTTSLEMGGVLALGDQPITWLTWWVGDMLGALAVGPLLLVWIPNLREINLRSTRTIEAAGIGLLLILTNIIVFWRPFSFLALFPYLYPVFIPIGWIALRFGVRGKTLAIFVTATMAVTAIASGHMLLPEIPIEYNLVFVQIFIATTGAMFLLFGSIIEERRRIMDQLETHMQKTEQTLSKLRFEDEAKKEFLALLAHELRNPLSPVVSGLEIIKDQPDITPASKSLLSSMRGQVRTMVRLIDDLLDISRISQKKLELQKEVVELHGVIKRGVRSTEPLFKKQKHTFSLKVPEEPVWFEADPVRLEQVMANLLTNAAKYTPPGGHIDCIVTVEDSTLRIVIKDNGIGIPSHMLERIFEPFTQVEQVRKQGSGIGVGLSLSRYLVEMHGGRIEAHSEGEGRGSEFVVTLPLILHDAPQKKHPKGAPLGSHQKSEKPSTPSHRTILVVDDNIPAAKGLSKLLTMRGYETKIAYTGEEAVSAYKEFYPGIVLLDIGLPDMNGYEVAKKIRKEKDRPSPLLIAITGYGQEEDKQKALEAGFDYHLTKPVGIEQLHQLLTAARLP